jgi:hypothetical protein
VLESAEEVLSRSVRVTWSGASPSFLVKIQRRAPGGAWETIGASFGGQQHSFVDRGPSGLAPGTWEYRVDGDGGPSAPIAVTIPEECSGQPPTSPLLPVVEIVDAEPDGDYDGDDVGAALGRCSQLHGCVLRALPVTYDDVNLELSLNTTYDFSRGLVIEGYGSATVFRSRVYSQSDHDPALCPSGGPSLCYQPSPVFSLARSGTPGLDGVRFRNFVIDGRKREQPDPGTPYVSWLQYGLFVASPSLGSTDRGCVHNVVAHDLLTGGFSIRNGNDWIFEYSSASDLGCQDDLTPCDAFEATPEILDIPGLQADGFGFATDSRTHGTVIRNSRAARAVKYGISAAFGAEAFHIHDNVVEQNGGSGIGCNTCNTGLIERNLVTSMHHPSGRNATWPAGYQGDTSAGINCVGTVHDLAISQNVVVSGDATGLRILCSGPGIRILGNAIAENCRKLGSSLQLAWTQDVEVLGNSIYDSAEGCQTSVSIYGSRGIRLEGGVIESGPKTGTGVSIGWPTQPTEGVVLRDLRVEGRGSPGAGLHIDAESAATTLYDSVCVSGYGSAVDDESPGGAIHASDPAAACSGS